MALGAGDQLGPYEITGHLGKGGMGEVYRATDTRLHRDVAVKVSSEKFSDLFEREARAVAALNHPHIGQLYDVGPNYLVMELVEGETLADRIRQGAIPLEEALGLARQIGEALEAAHEKGIVHRDLKPSNIKITPEGTAKVLDFGLAKIAEPLSQPESDPEHSPTLTLEAAPRLGAVMGTAGYMAPEQAKGKRVDKRADIWAFGAMLYEMVTGNRLFQGEDLTEILASVVKERPDLSAAPAKVRRLLARCLEKDPKKRLRDIGDAWELLEEPPASPVTAPEESRAGRLPWVITAAFATAFAVVSFLWLRTPEPEMQSFQFLLDASKGPNQNARFAASPDGRYLTYVGEEGGKVQLWIRPLDSIEAKPLQGTDDARSPFWSPDSKSIAYSAGGKLKRVDAAGGAPQVIGDISYDLGGTWNSEGTILLGSRWGLFRVPASGGVPQLLTQIDSARKETAHVWPVFLPDRKRYLYLIESADPNTTGVYAGSLDNPTERARVLATDSRAFYVPAPAGKGGFLLWTRDTTLVAQRFDAKSLRLEGGPTPVADMVSVGPSGVAAYSASQSGLLIFVVGEGRDSSTLTWVDRQGRISGTLGSPENYGELSLSPDGSVLAVFRRGSADQDLWLIDIARGASTRLTTDPANESWPVWSPDGKQIAFGSTGDGPFDLYRKPAGVSGQESLLWKDGDSKIPSDWSSDGRFLLYSAHSSQNAQGGDLWVLPMNGENPKPVKYLATPFNEVTARFSPDGRWVVYVSNVSGTNEVYVSPFPDAASAPAAQISTGGGTQPRWRRDGKAVYYLSADGKLMEVDVTPGTTLKAGIPKQLFDAPVTRLNFQSVWAWTWDTPDDRRFLINKAQEQQRATPLTVITNWPALLKK